MSTTPSPTSSPTPPASAPPPTNSNTTTPPPLVVPLPPVTVVSPPSPPVLPPASSSPPPPIAPVTTPTPSTPTPSTPTPTTPAITPSSSPPPPADSPPSPPGKTPTPTTPVPTTPGSRGSPPSTPLPPSNGKSPPQHSSSAPPSPPGSSPAISTGLVVGVAIGGVVMLVFLGLLFFCCKKKKRRDDGQLEYYPPPPPGPKGGPYGAPPQQWAYNAHPPPADHVVMVPSNLPPPPGVALRPQLSTNSNASVPSQPPPFMSSGSNYSDYDQSPRQPPAPGMSLGFSKSLFTHEELIRATDGFSEANLLGQGGFGYVHKGVLPNGKEVAVKQLKVGSGQGEREFQAEVEIISRVHHKHLVTLVGYCSTGSQRMLVYEFVPNNTLEFHLHGKSRPTMDWASRHRIALGSAKGLAYLHEDCHPKIIHRDIKAANILLDMKFEAKVADFGLAKFSSDTNTHVSTRVMGTFGYLAPEYAASGKLTEKSDVFSFGVMLLELITGRRPVDSANTYMDDSLVDWARPLILRAQETGDYSDLIDPKLHNYNQQEMARMVDCAAASVRHSSRRRPQMSQIVRALEGDGSLADLSEGIKPGHSTMYSSHGSSDYDTFQYNEDMKKFRKIALTSEEYGSSEYSGVATSEYGLNPSGSSSEGQFTREMQARKTRKDSQGFSGTS